MGTGKRSKKEAGSKERRAGGIGSFEIQSEPVVDAAQEEDVHKFEATLGQAHVPAFEDLGSLPSGYGTNSVYLIARDPHWLFSYWDVNWGDFPVSGMLGGAMKVYVKLHEPDARDVLTIEVKPESCNWYIQAPAANTRYFAELGYFDGDGKWAVVAQSAVTQTPSDKISGEHSAVFATLPIHLTYQHVMDLISGARRDGESLVQTLARLQNEARGMAFARQKRDWTEEERFIINSILGQAVSSGGLSSAELLERMRQYLEERLSSESASALLSKLLQEVSSSEVSSAMFAKMLSEKLSSEVSSEMFSVLLRERLSSEVSSEVIARFLQERLSSEVASQIMARIPFERVSSETSSEVFARIVTETLSSALSSEQWVRLLQETLSSETSSAVFSQLFQQRISSEVSSEIFARLLWERLSSQSASELLSRGLFWSAETSSLFSAFGPLGAFGSWGAFGSETMALLKAAETFGSWGAFGSEVTSWSGSWSGALGASWSAQPFSQPFQREFFLHVNAEVIFYGGTHPDAKVTVAGQPVQLNADGSFRFHYRFPDGTYEVPIVAISPDGVEQRSATLRFDRGTQRVGIVGYTAQPKDLAVPVGKRD